MLSDELKDRIQKIKLVALDVDGVLTDGRMVYGNFGDELKFFDSQDGLGCALLARVGIKVIIITSKKSRINECRAKEIKITKLYQKVDDKLKALQKAASKFKVDLSEICFMGDDLIDLAAMRHSGFSAAVQNAVEEVKNAAHYITAKKGGRGAVREVAELILKTQKKWHEATERYYRD